MGLDFFDIRVRVNYSRYHKCLITCHFNSPDLNFSGNDEVVSSVTTE